MKAKAIMSGDIACCRPESPMTEAVQLMWDHDCGLLPVVDRDGRLEGVVTDRDIAMSAGLGNRRPGDTPVAEAMTRDVATVRPQDGIETIHRRMRERRVRRIIVVDENRRPVGVVSLNDLSLKASHDKSSAARDRQFEVAVTLGSICEHREAVPA